MDDYCDWGDQDRRNEKKWIGISIVIVIIAISITTILIFNTIQQRESKRITQLEDMRIQQEKDIQQQGLQQEVLRQQQETLRQQQETLKQQQLQQQIVGNNKDKDKDDDNKDEDDDKDNCRLSKIPPIPIYWDDINYQIVTNPNYGASKDYGSTLMSITEVTKFSMHLNSKQYDCIRGTLTRLQKSNYYYCSEHNKDTIKLVLVERYMYLYYEGVNIAITNPGTSLKVWPQENGINMDGQLYINTNIVSC